MESITTRDRFWNVGLTIALPSGEADRARADLLFDGSNPLDLS